MKRSLQEFLKKQYALGKANAVIRGCFALFAITLLISGWMIYSWFADGTSSRALFGSLALIRGGVSEDKEDTKVIQEGYRDLYDRNPDLFGWIRINGTPIDYPVMQTPYDPEYYINHDYDRSPSVYGVPFAQANCDPYLSDNIIIHAHHMKDGSMFAKLLSYQSKEFWEAHPTIEFDTLYENYSYKVIAAFRTPANNGFRYTGFVYAQNESVFAAYVDKCLSLSLYDTGITAEYGDKLITLATCEYMLDDGRFVVVGRRKESD